MLTRHEIEKTMLRLAEERAGLRERLVERRRAQVDARSKVAGIDRDVKAIEERLDAIEREAESWSERLDRAS